MLVSAFVKMSLSSQHIKVGRLPPNQEGQLLQVHQMVRVRSYLYDASVGRRKDRVERERDQDLHTKEKSFGKN